MLTDTLINLFEDVLKFRRMYIKMQDTFITWQQKGEKQNVVWPFMPLLKPKMVKIYQ